MFLSVKDGPKLIHLLTVHGGSSEVILVLLIYIVHDWDSRSLCGVHFFVDNSIGKFFEDLDLKSSR